MKSTTLALGTLLAAVAVAQPHHQHQAFHNRQKRDGEPVEWVTEIEYTTEVIDYTTTIWVTDGYVAPTTTSATSTSTTAIAAQFFQGPQSSSTTESTTSTTSIVVAPTPTSTSVAITVPAPTTDAPIVAAVVTPVVAPVTVETPTSTVPVVAPVVAPTVSIISAAPAPVVSPESSSGSSGIPVNYNAAACVPDGDCNGPSSCCSGDITYYDTGYPGGYGSCGDITDGTKVPVIALPIEFMGTLSNSNPFCGRNVTIIYGSKSVNATVVDKCVGCNNRSIDLSHFAFDALSDEGIGRTQATWFFID